MKKIFLGLILFGILCSFGLSQYARTSSAEAYPPTPTAPSTVVAEAYPPSPTTISLDQA